MNSNVKNIYKNTIIGFIIKISLLVLSFVNRSIFIKLLGEEFLGISGLYSNIISLLSLADLGIYTASMYSLYKPLSENNYNKIASLIKYFSKLYRIIGIFVIIIGICLTPFLKYFISDVTLSSWELKSYYLLFVLNSGLSYFNVSKTLLLRADKNVYLIEIITSISTLIAYVLQIVLLKITNNYYTYLAVQIFITILTNVLLTIITNKKYPYLRELRLTTEELDTDDKNSVVKNIKSVVVVKISGVIMNSTDNILISLLLGAITVGYYSNYNLIIVSLSSFITIIINAIIPNIGEINTRENKDELLTSFKLTNLIFNFLAVFITATLICIFNDFINLWIKDEKYVLPLIDVILICVNFYITCITNPLWMFTESIGLFKEVKYLLFIAAVLNIVLSIVFASFLGLGGIILATGISRILTMFWYEPMVLYKKVFKEKIYKYWFKTLMYILIGGIVCAVCYYVCSLIGYGIVNFMLKGIICLFITIVIFVIVMFRTEEFKCVINFIKKRR